MQKFDALINEYEILREYSLQQVDVEKVKLEYLKKMWARMSCDEEERKNFMKILDIYFERLQEREQIM